MSTSLPELPCEALQRHARERPNTNALNFLPDGEGELHSWTYAELLARARAIAAALPAQAGARVLLLHPPGLEFIASLYACWLAGVVAIPTALPRFSRNNRAAARLAELVRDAQPAVALTSAARLDHALVFCRGVPGLRELTWQATDAAPGVAANAAPVATIVEVSAEAAALIQYTSGSTGRPRGVVLSHANLASNQAAIQQAFGHSTASRVMSWLPPYHDMGLIGGILQPLTVGCPVLLMDPAHFMQRPLRWLQAISRFRATTSGGPDFAYQLCARAAATGAGALEGLDLSCWDLAFSGAEPVRAATLHNFHAAYAGHGFQAQAFYPCYGLAEATLLVSGSRKGDGARLLERDGATHVGCGSAAVGHQLQIVDQDGQICAPGTVGEIWVTGPSVAQAYLNRPEETAATFHARLAGAGEQRFLRTGDLGCVEQGELLVLGRLKDLIIVRGRNIYPHDLEDYAGACHPAIAASVAFSIETGDGEQVVVACEIDRHQRHGLDAARVMQAVREVLAREFDLHVHTVVLLPAGAILRTTSGKVRRSACREAWSNGQWEEMASAGPQAVAASLPAALAADAAAAMTGASTQERIAGLLRYLERRTAQVLGVGPAQLMPQQALADQGVDSLMRVELLLQVEADLGVALEAANIDGDTTLTGLAEQLHQACLERDVQPEGEASFDATMQDGAVIPLTPIQQEFFRPGLEHPEKLHTIVYLRLPPGTDMARLEAAIHGLELRFDALRMRYEKEESGWRQRLAPPGSATSFRRLDLSQAAPGATRAAGQEIYENLHTGFDLAQGPLLQAIWLDSGAGKPGALALATHHLAVDGTSMAVLLVELERAFRYADKELPRARKAASFADWAGRLQAFAQTPAALTDLAHWQTTCGEAAAPADPVEAGKWSVAVSQLAPAVLQSVLQACPSSQAQHDLFLTLLAAAWQRVSGAARVLVRLESHGRVPLDGGGAPATTVGWLTSRHPVAIPVPQTDDLATLYRAVQQIVHAVPNHGLSHGLLLHSNEQEAVRASMARLAQPAIGMVYRSRLDHGFRADALFPAFSIKHMNQSRSMDESGPTLILEAGRSNTTINWRIVYASEAHDATTITALMREIETLLLAVDGSIAA